MAPKRCVPKKWQQVQRIANRAERGNGSADTVLVSNIPRCPRKRAGNPSFRLSISSKPRRGSCRRNATGGMPGKGASVPELVIEVAACRGNRFVLMSRAAPTRLPTPSRQHRSEDRGELHDAAPQCRVAVMCRDGEGGALRRRTAASFGTAFLSMGYNVAGKATDPVKAKDDVD